MTDQPDANYPQLSRDELLALKFAAHRQLSRWAKSQRLGARKQAQRRASGSGWCMHDGDHATLSDARAYVDRLIGSVASKELADA